MASYLVPSEKSIVRMIEHERRSGSTVVLPLSKSSRREAAVKDGSLRDAMASLQIPANEHMCLCASACATKLAPSLAVLAEPGRMPLALL